ncbi:hypothetical protein [Paenibacillus sp. KS-LC4]|uniref:hypothetical protein n=1 Tax=Paenibacillus sp. KS-LC4 TaxID=2979727 RepID=UPI0030D15333
MTERILPIVEPPIYGYLCNAYPLAIALQNKNAEAWFFSNFIQLVSAGNFPEGKFFNFYNSYYEWDTMFLSCPFINFQKIHYNYLEKYEGNLVEFMCDSINTDGYIYLYVDEYYISHMEAYFDYHMFHEMLVFGYNKEKKKFNVLGYNSKRVFGQYEVDFDELVTAFRMCDKTISNRKYIYILEYNEDYQYDFDLQLVFQSLKHYRFSLNSSLNFRALHSPNYWWIYGMSAYELFLKYLRHNIGELHERIDDRLFHTIWEHKNVMVERIKYMMENEIIKNDGSLLNAYTYISECSLILKNLVLKYNFKEGKRLLDNIVEKLTEIKKCEEAAVDLFLNVLGSTLQDEKSEWNEYSQPTSASPAI